MEGKREKIEVPVVLLLGGVLVNIFGFFLPPPLKRRLEQDNNYGLPNQLIGANEAIALRRRKKISADFFFKQLRYAGVREEYADLLYQLSERLLEISDLVELRKKGVINPITYLEKTGELGLSIQNAEDIFKGSLNRLPPEIVITAIFRKIKFGKGEKDLKNELIQQGWTEGRIETILKTALFYPAPADWVYFARRDIFNPTAVETFGYDEGYPKDREADVAKAGVSPEFWKYYWRAHWRDLGTGEIFTMLHRRVINDSEASMLLRTSNYAPKLAEKLKKTAYNPYSRIDIRRMYKLGVVDRDEVKKTYLDLGYDEEHAENLTKFVEKWAAEPTAQEATPEDQRREELRGLTRSAIISQYKNYLIKEDEVKEYLKDLGYSEEVADFYTQNANYEMEQDRINKYLTAYRRMYINGVLTYNETSDALDKLNVPAYQKEQLLNLWELDKTGRPSQPSKSDLINFLKAGIIKVNTFIDKMEDLGYNKVYVNWYLQLLNAKEKHK